MAILNLVYSAREIAQVPSRIASQMTLATDTTTAEYRSVQWAVRKYSVCKPRNLSISLTPSGDWEYALETLITGWKFSSYSIQDIISPANTSDSQYINLRYFDQNKWDKQDYTVVKNPLDSNKAYLRFLNYKPLSSTTDKMVVLYTAPHTVDATADTVSDEEDQDTEAFAYLVASRILFVAANYFARLDDSTVNIATVDNQQKSNTYNQRSKDAMRVYQDHMDAQIAHTGRIDWDFYNQDSEERFWMDSRLQ